MTAGKRGFSLIEALAALIIASLVLLAAYSLQQQMLDAERRYERALALSELKRTTIVLIRDVNPAAEPRGSRALAGNRIARWTASPRGAFVRATGGLHEVRLYRMTVVLHEADGRPAGQLQFDRVGWRPVSATEPALPSRSAAGPP